MTCACCGAAAAIGAESRVAAAVRWSGFAAPSAPLDVIATSLTFGYVAGDCGDIRVCGFELPALEALSCERGGDVLVSARVFGSRCRVAKYRVDG